MNSEMSWSRPRFAVFIVSARLQNTTGPFPVVGGLAFGSPNDPAGVEPVDVVATGLPSSSSQIVTMPVALELDVEPEPPPLPLTAVYSPHSAETLISRSVGVDVLNTESNSVTVCAEFAFGCWFWLMICR